MYKRTLPALFTYEIGRLIIEKHSPPILCPVMRDYPMKKGANKTLRLCDCPNARRVALEELHMRHCGTWCPPRALLGFSPTTDQK
jgi:hypothetical protein